MIKLIVSDLDGTLLLPSRQALEHSTLELIEKLLDAGYTFVAASGRQYTNIRRMFGHLADRLHYICENGSLVVYKNQIIYKALLPEEQKIKLIDDILRHDTAELLYSAPLRCYIQPKEEYYRELVVDRVKNDTVVVEDMRKVTEECVKLSIYERGKIGEQEEAYWLEHYGDDLYAVRSSEKWLDFMSKESGKGKALNMIMEQENCSAAECMAFGDNDNDVDMMRLAGHSYGMRHGTEALRRCAGQLIDHPEEILRTLV